VRPGARIVVTEHEPFGGSLIVSVDGITTRLSPGAARNVFVTLDPEDAPEIRPIREETDT
jgi:Fe2+ transport system protein FeoA